MCNVELVKCRSVEVQMQALSFAVSRVLRPSLGEMRALGCPLRSQCGEKQELGPVFLKAAQESSPSTCEMMRRLSYSFLPRGVVAVGDSWKRLAQQSS